METLREAPECQISAVGLNRTMQYGNYYSPKMKITLREQFKSYYVVWKLQKYVLF